MLAALTNSGLHHMALSKQFITKTQMKRIGVLTFHNGPNFGGFLQAWHMVQAIRSLGYECHAVNYLHSVHQEANKIKIPIKNLDTLRARIFWALKKRGFRGTEDSICKNSFTSDPNQVPWHEYEEFVVGSDIVWDYHQPSFGKDPAYFGQIQQLTDKPLIAYAASCGPADPNGPFPDYVSAGLKNFTSIGVRDDATATLVRNASDRDSTLVVDPTWLGPDPDIPWSGLPKQKYLFAYGSRFDGRFGPQIRDYCRARGWLLVSALSSCRWADKMYRSLTPFQWVQLFKHAEATVIVGTLHGTVYSIKYGKPFILLTSPTTTQKISSILKRIGQSHRLIQPEQFVNQSLDMLDDQQFARPEIPPVWKSDSLRYLKNSLESASAISKEKM
jgi:hypothetical protein